MPEEARVEPRPTPPCHEHVHHLLADQSGHWRAGEHADEESLLLVEVVGVHVVRCPVGAELRFPRKRKGSRSLPARRGSARSG
jgi:hypothetical protein